MERKRSQRRDSPVASQVLLRRFLVTSVFVANSAIMALELVASRLIAQFLGQSLYTWTTLIGVMLTGMAIGSAIGGRLADRKNPFRSLAALYLLASFGCVCVLFLNEGLGHWQALRVLSWPMRIVLHIFLTFTLPAVLLGAISPIVARITIGLPGGTGRAVGSVYAAAALGSIGGTLLTGFYLTEIMGSRAMVLVAASLLLVLGMVYVVVARRSANLRTADEESAPQTNIHGGDSKVSRFDWPIACAAIFASNAAFMVFELAASRMATRALGYSLYTWTTLLAVVLAGITVGNYVGGRMADRYNPRRLLSAFFVLAAIACLATPPINEWLTTSNTLSSYSWVNRTVLHICIAFTVPPIFIGLIGPCVARLALGLGRASGRTLGQLYAWGALGSVIGTFLTGFVLIDRLWPIATMCILALFLAFFAMVYGKRRLTPYIAAALCSVAVAFSLAPWPSVVRLGETWKYRETADRGSIYLDHSQYGRVAVVADAANPNLRSMFLDRLLHGTDDISDPLAMYYDYLFIYEGVMNEHYPDQQPVSTLTIGGGGFVYPKFIAHTRPGSYVEVAEIDPAVTDAARATFDLDAYPDIRVFNMDARNRINDLLRLKSAGELEIEFDCILGDSFNQFSVPFQLTTLEFNQAVYDLLADDGLYLMNLIDGYNEGLFLGSVLQTLNEVFPHLYVFSTAPRGGSDRDTYVVVAAKQSLSVAGLPSAVRAARPYVGELFRADEVQELMARDGTRVLTDDFAPVDNLLARIVNTLVGSPVTDEMAGNAATLMARGDYEQAAAALRELAGLEPENVAIQQRLGVALAETGAFDDAIAVFKGILEKQPDSRYIHYNIGSALAQSGRLDEAVPYYEEAVKQDPDLAEAHFVLAQYRMRQNRIGEALVHFSRTTSLQPENGHARYLYGRLLSKRGRGREALVQLAAAVRLLPDTADPHYVYGIALAQAERFADAEREFREAIRVAPEFSAAHLNLGNVLFKTGDLPAAARSYERAVVLEPENASPHYNLGRIELSLGDAAAAIAHFERAIQLNPQLTVAKQALEEAKAQL